MNTLENVHDWLRFMVARKASDLFLTAGFPPFLGVSPLQREAGSLPGQRHNNHRQSLFYREMLKT
mgnify:CR=1 FL=1